MKTYVKVLGIDLDTKRVFGGFTGGSVVKNLPAHAEDAGPIPGSGRSPGEGKGNPLQYSCLENSLDRGTWRATVHRVAKSRTRLKRLSMHNVTLSHKKNHRHVISLCVFTLLWKVETAWR